MTFQVPDKVIYNGEPYFTYSNPFYQYRIQFEPKERPQFVAVFTSNYNGYHAVYSVIGEKLFMIKFEGNLRLDIDHSTRDVGLDYLFPNQKEVFADWFSGSLHLWTDEQYHNRKVIGDPNQGDELYLEFKNGILTNSGKKNYNEIYNLEIKETQWNDEDLPPVRRSTRNKIARKLFPNWFKSRGLL